MSIFSSQIDKAKSAWGDSTSPASPGARFGLAFDPTSYMLDLFGKGDEYRKAVEGSGDWMNERLSGALGTSDRGGWAANKPASTIGLMVGGYYGGSGLLGSSGFGAGGSSQGSLGIFSNGGSAGLQGVGGGNAGALASQGGIGGGAGLGAAGSAAGPGTVGFSSNPQSYMNLAQQMGGGQQQQPQQDQRKPYWVRGNIVWM